MKLLKTIYNNNFLALGLLVVLAMVLYYPMQHAGINKDYLSWLYKYEAGSYADVINCFDYHGLHQVFHLANYTIYRLVGADAFGQYVIFSFSHGLVGYTLFRLLKKLTQVHHINNALPIVYITVLLFLIAPYQIEVVTWKACYHYLMVTGFIYTSYYQLVVYLETSRWQHLIWHHLLFLLALFSLEISLAAPFIFIVYTVFFVLEHKDRNWTKIFLTTGLVQLGFLVIYFFLNKVLLGDWIGHYGADTHLDVKADSIFGTGLKYFVKQLFLIHFLPYDIKHYIYSLLSKPFIYYSGTGILLLGFGWFTMKFKDLSQNVKIAGLSILQFFMALVPIVTLYFMYTFWYENDRYGYLASGFLYFAFIVLIFQMKKYLRIPILIIYIGLTFFLFVRMGTTVYKGANVYKSLIDDFRWYDAEEVVILSIPYNYQGMYMYVDYTEIANEFKEAMYWYKGVDLKVPLVGISQFNMMKSDDKIGVEVMSRNQLRVMIGQGGTWFWRIGYGFTDFENDEFKASIDGWFFMLDIKKQKPGRVFIYPDGGKWKQVDFGDK